MTPRRREREAWLDELRLAHRAEAAPATLRRRLLERLDESSGRHAEYRRIRGVGVLAALSAVGLMLLRPPALPSWPADHEPAATALADLALGPEPRNTRAPRAAGSGERDGRRVSEPPLAAGGRPCPLAEVPRGAVIAPEKFGRDGLTVHTFDMLTQSCGRITRRYLQLAAPGMLARSNAPVLVVLHDTGGSAETMAAAEGRWRFDELARREGLILVYANAAPGAATNVGVANSGGWRGEGATSDQVDDDEYLKRMVDDLRWRGVISGGNDVYLAGHAAGAQRALDAASRDPERYAGVAAFFPPRAEAITLSHRDGARLSRILLVLGTDSRQVVPSSALARRWGRALGISQRVIAQRWQLGDPEAPFGVLEQFDTGHPASGSAAVRLLVVEGSFEPVPGAREAWRFLSGIDGADSAVPDDLPDLPVEPLFADGESVLPEDADGYEYPSLVLDEDVVVAPVGR